MDAMPMPGTFGMPGGMPGPGPIWLGATWLGAIGAEAVASFLGMWMLMMAAMMLPSLVPMLWRFREALERAGETQLGRLTALAAIGYFFVWTMFGMVAFAASALVAVAEMQLPALTRAVPAAVGLIVLIAGWLQFSAWKAHHLACCRVAPPSSNVVSGNVVSGDMVSVQARQAWRYGLSLGRHCCACSFSMMVILFAVGIMDLGAMAVITAAITLERLAPAGERIARAIGAVLVGAGLFLMAQAVLPG